MTPRRLAVPAFALLVYAAPASAASTCSYADGVATVTVGGAATVAIGTGGGLLVDGAPCDGATTANTTLVALDAAGGTAALALPFAIPVTWIGGGALVVSGSSGPDVLTVVAGGVQGDVTVTFDGPRPAVTLLGNWGADLLTGSAGPEVIDGGFHGDTVRPGGGDDRIDCGDERTDTLRFDDAQVGLTIDLWNRVVTGNGTTTVEDCEAVYATEHDDVIMGSGDPEFLYALGGDDVVASSGGPDTVDAGPGDDVVDEHDGFGFERDLVAGGDGVDLLTYAGRGDPVAVNHPTPIPHPPHMYVDQDVTSGFENVTGGDGADRLWGDAGANVIDGGPGADVIEGLDGADTIRGGAGNDVITPGAGDDLVDAGDGNDMVVEGSAPTGRDDIRGGAGTDLADYGRRVLPVVIGLDDAAGDGNPGEDDNVHSDVEDLWGGQLGDHFTGNDAVNRFWGFGGADLLVGGGGRDELYGGVDADILYAEDGLADWLHGEDGADIGYRDAVDNTNGVEVLLPP